MDLFAGADVSSAGGARESSGAFPGRGTHVPPQGGSFAWRTDEWYLAHETLKPTKGRAGASELVHDPSRTARVVGSTLTASLVAAVDPAPPGPRESPAARVSPEDALGGHASGSLGSLGSLGSREGSERPANGAERVSALRPGASPLGRRRKGAAPRTCSARGCGAHVLDRAQGLVVMCPAHRRVTSGVAVDTGDALMRWCYHCKKAHELGAFADSVIGLSRKLATCERGRAARRAAFAKKAADGARAASEGQRTRSDGDGVDGESLGVLSRGGVRGANAQTDPTYARAGKSGSAPFRPKSEAETLAAVASARARGRSKRQQDLLDANPSRSGSHFSRSGSPPGSKSGSRDSAPYPSAAGVFSSPAADLARFASSEVPDRSSHDLARASADVTTRHDSRGFQTGHQPMRRAPTEDERTSDARQISANARDWRRRAFEDVAFEVSTRASPLELIGEKRSVFEQMAGFMGRAVTSDPPNALEQDHDADWTSRLERAANGVRHFDNGNFFMDLGEVQSMLDSDDAEPTLESDANAGSGQTRLAGDDPSGTRFSPPIASRGWYDSLAASMLPGSTRVICTARAGLLEAPGSAREWADDAPRRGALPGSILDRGAAMAGAETLARAVAPDGAIGRRTATVTAHPAVRVGAGWAADDGDCERDVVFDRESPKSFLASDSVVVVSDDSGRASLARERVTPFPSYVTVPPFAALGDAIAIRGLRGGERVHVFGQGAQPFSAVVPRGGGVDAVRITPPSLATGAAGAPSVVPGFMYVQVLAPGQPATGAAFVKVLLVDDPAVVAELDALGRGAGATCEGLVAAPVGAPALPATRGFSGTAAFERFLSDLGALIESHWRSLLYTPAGRAAMRAVCLGFGAVVKDDSACPALRAALADVAEDVDAQRRFEDDARLCSGAPVARRSSLKSESGFGHSSDRGTRDPRSRENGESFFPPVDASRSTFGAFGFRTFRRRRAGSLRAGGSSGSDGETSDARAMALIERESLAFIMRQARRAAEMTPTRVLSFCAALAPSYATRLTLRAVLDDRSEIARRVFAGDETVAMTPQTRASLYSHAMSAVALFILVGVFRAEDWKVDPLRIIQCYCAWFPAFLLHAVFARDPRVWSWLKRRSWMMGSGGALWDDAARREISRFGRGAAASVDRARRAERHSHAHDACMFVILMASNGVVRSMIDLEDARDWKWLTGAVLLIGNTLMYSVLSAEYVRPGRKRWDIPAAVVLGAGLYACPPNVWARVFATNVSPARALAEHFLRQTHPNAYVAALLFFVLPCLAGALARRFYRVYSRLVLFAKLDAAGIVECAESRRRA